jgi:farnesyl-diphosphate farnesyltransferase
MPPQGNMTSKRSALSLSAAEITYLDKWMNKVSRSFALVVASLEEPMSHYLEVAYLICRVIDTVEDCMSAPAWKDLRFEEIKQLLVRPSLAKLILPVWDSEPWPGIMADQRQVMTFSDGFPLWQIYARLPHEVKSIISRWGLKMAQGMMQLENPHMPPWIIRSEIRILAQEYDYDQYCYIVAGTVGHMATELVILQYGMQGELAQKLLQNCEACGNSLQKTNIVKDFLEDLGRGVCYLPDEWLSQIGYSPLALRGSTPDWSRRVLGNVLSELQTATGYILTLPYEVAGYRMASLLCLLPAYQTILMAAQQHGNLFTNKHPHKISHAVFGQCIQDAQAMLTDNAAVWEYSQELTRSIKAQFAGV